MTTSTKNEIDKESTKSITLVLSMSLSWCINIVLLDV
jgi:hypothetical protein